MNILSLSISPLAESEKLRLKVSAPDIILNIISLFIILSKKIKRDIDNQDAVKNCLTCKHGVDAIALCDWLCELKFIPEKIEVYFHCININFNLLNINQQYNYETRTLNNRLK